MRTASTQLSTTIQDLNLERYVLELEVDGLTVVPPEVHGVPMERFDAMVNLLLARAEEMVGCAFSLDKGPRSDVAFPADANTFAAMSGEHGEPRPRHEASRGRDSGMSARWI